MDINELKRRISEDKKRVTSSYRRYPVRFVFMEMNNKTQDDIMNLVRNTNGELLELSDFIMKKDDGWMTKSRFIQIIKEYTSKSKDTYVLGFSELIRFFSKKEIESTILSLFDIENQNIMDDASGKRRIYFICFSMVDNIYRVLQSCFPRKELLNPFINPDYEPSGYYREVCFVSNDYIDNIPKNKITSSVEWLGLWRHSDLIDFECPIWCCSENLYEWHQKASPDNAFQIDVVTNSKDYIRKCYSIEIDFVYYEEDSEYWNELKDRCISTGSPKTIQEIVSKELSIDINSTAELFGKYGNIDDGFKRWLIKNYTCTYLANTYLAKVFRLSKSFSNKELMTIIWKQGYMTDDTELLSERSQIIKELSKYAESSIPEVEIQEVIIDGVRNELSIDLVDAEDQSDIRLERISARTGRDILELRNHLFSYYLRIFKPAYTGLSNFEKEFVLSLYSNEVLQEDELKSIYPSFYYYLYGTAEALINGKEECKEYLKAYRESKAVGKDNEYLKNYYESGKADSNTLYSIYYTLPRQDHVVSSFASTSDLYVIDGLGAEYLPLLVELIKNKGYQIESCDYAVCHLPSITNVNKAYLSRLQIEDWVLTFDRTVIHGDFYKTGQSLRKAFDVLEKIVKDIVSEAGDKRIVITSDHGATARAKWVDTKKKYSFENADHEGRCCAIFDKSAYNDNADYIVFEDEESPGSPYLISLNATSLNNRPRYEDHGGATLEEILVPVVIAIPAVNLKKYKVFCEKQEVSGLDKIVSFSIIPTPDSPIYLVESDGEKQELKLDGAIFVAELKSGKDQDVTVVVDEKEYRFHIENKSKKNMEGDDGFDD